MTKGLCQLDEVSVGAGGPRLGPSRARLSRITAQIPQGLTALMGPSGAGKTTLLNLLAGFESPGSGTIHWEAIGREESTEPPASYQLPVAWMPADFGLWPDLTIAEHLAATAPMMSPPETVAHWLDLFELHPGQRFPGQLSRGEQSRLSLARAVASEAPVLILDEPCAHLQAALSQRLWRALTRHWRARGTSVIYSTHQPELVLGVADHLLMLAEGRLIAEASPLEIYERPASEEVAWIVGPTNWFEPKEQTRWWGHVLDHPSVRPERLELIPTPGSPLVVTESHHAGPLQRVELAALPASSEEEARSPTVSERSVWTIPRGSPPAVGTSVVLRLMMALWLLLGTLGCEGSSEPTISIVEETSWMLPADGPLVPAPRGLCVSPAGELLVLDTAGRVLVYSPKHELLRSWHMPEYSVGKAEGICVLKDGRIAVADTHYHRVVIFQPDGTVSHIFGTEGTGPAQFIYPVAITQDPEGFLYVCEYGSNDRCQKLTVEGEMIVEMGRFGLGPGEFQRPSGVAWSDGKLHIVDAFNSRVQVFDATTGKLLDPGFNRAELAYPYDICAGEVVEGRARDFWIVEYASGQVTRLSDQGELRGRGFATQPLRTPWGLCYDPQGQLYVADTGNRKIVCWKLGKSNFPTP
ncbi:MAG: hypothetical protein C0478_10655 [Planctomyces sp.]|nr:hypothetical protein [Planctomyces sp.]